MEPKPALALTTFGKLVSGDLCIVLEETVSYVAMCASDPADHDDPALLILGPSFPPERKGITLARRVSATVLSHAKKVTLRLPADPDGWTHTCPPPDQPSILLAGKGAFFVASFRDRQGFYDYPRFIDISTGRVEAINFSYAVPPGPQAYATRWEILTIEEEPRVILTYPQPH